MNNKLQIQLGETKNINSVNVNNFINLLLSRRSKLINEYNIRNVLSATEIYEREREEYAIYRIHGKLEYLSILNGVADNYNTLSDFFLPQKTGNVKNIMNSFDFYLLKPSNDYVEIQNTPTNHIRKFEVIGKPTDIDIFPVGFSKNLFDEQEYSFICNKDFDMRFERDYFNFPITELFLFAQYKRRTTPPIENFMRTIWNETTGNPSIETVTTQPTYEIGDLVYGDLIDYNKKEFEQTIISGQTHYIRTPYNSNNLEWKYNPFIPLKLRYFYNDLNKENISGSSYEDISKIPDYATYIEDGYYVWKDILEQGILDPITDLGVDYPFVNRKRYLFINEILSIVPNLVHANTSTVFDEIKRLEPSTIDFKSIGNINDFGLPCK